MKYVVDATTEKNGTYRVLTVATGDVSRMGMDALDVTDNGHVVIIRTGGTTTAEDAFKAAKPTRLNYCNID